MTALRDKLLDTPKGPSSIVEIDEETTVEVRSLSIETARQLQRKVEAKPEWSEEDLDLLYVVESTYDPETGDKVFEHADVDALRQKPASADHWINDVIMEVTSLMTGHQSDPETEALDRVEMYLTEMLESIDQAEPDDISASAQNQLAEAIEAAREVCRAGRQPGKM